MNDTLTGRVQRLIGSIPPGEEAVRLNLLRRILKYSDDDRALAYCMGLYVKEYPADSPAAREAELAIETYIEANELGYYFTLKERPAVPLPSVQAVLLGVLGFLMAFFSAVSFLKSVEPSEALSVTLTKLFSSVTVFFIIGLFFLFASVWKLILNKRRAVLMSELEDMSMGNQS